MMDFQLVKAGYGTLKEVREMSSREYLQALGFEKFREDYAAAFRHLNQPEARRK